MEGLHLRASEFFVVVGDFIAIELFTSKNLHPDRTQFEYIKWERYNPSAGLWETQQSDRTLFVEPANDEARSGSWRVVAKTLNGIEKTLPFILKIEQTAATFIDEPREVNFHRGNLFKIKLHTHAVRSWRLLRQQAQGWEEVSSGKVHGDQYKYDDPTFTVTYTQNGCVNESYAGLYRVEITGFTGEPVSSGPINVTVDNTRDTDSPNFPPAVFTKQPTDIHAIAGEAIDLTPSTLFTYKRVIQKSISGEWVDQAFSYLGTLTLTDYATPEDAGVYRLYAVSLDRKTIYSNPFRVFIKSPT